MKRVAVLGCGAWGRQHVRNFDRLGALELVYDPDEGARELARSLAPSARIASEAERAFEASVDAVVLATPAPTHYELARRALLEGKDVLCEKPLALSAAEGAELIELAERGRRILMVGHVLEYHPAIGRLRHLVDSGELGALQYLYSHRLSWGRVRSEENVLWSFAPHDLSVILRLVGSMPTQVSASASSHVRPEIADVTVGSLVFPGQVRAHVHVSWLHPFKEQRLVVIGARAMACFDDVAKRLLLYERPEPGAPARREATSLAYSDAEPLRLECEAFLDALETRRPPLTDGPSGGRVLRVLEAAARSMSQGGAPQALEAP